MSRKKPVEIKFGEEYKRILDSRRMHYADMAKLINVGRTNSRRWYIGDAIPSLKYLNRLQDSGIEIQIRLIDRTRGKAKCRG